MNTHVRTLLMILALVILSSLVALSQERQGYPPLPSVRDSVDSVKTDQQRPLSDSTTSLASRRQVSTLELPLAPDTLGLTRPRFPTIRFCVGAGVMWSDYSGVEQFTEHSSGVSVPVEFAIGIPLYEEPNIEFFGGWGFAAGGVGGGSATTFNASVLFRPSGFVPFGPIIGVGGGNTTYSFDGAVIIKASRSYPLISAGVTIIPYTLDILLMIPLAEEMRMGFESLTYTIRPSGPVASIFFSL